MQTNEKRRFFRISLSPAAVLVVALCVMSCAPMHAGDSVSQTIESSGTPDLERPISVVAAELPVGSDRNADRYVASYQSVVAIVPEADLTISAVRVRMFRCVGNCQFTLRILDGETEVAAAHWEGGAPQPLWVRLNAPVRLIAGKEYAVDARLGSTGGIGIASAADASECRGVRCVVRGVSDPRFGPLAFQLYE